MKPTFPSWSPPGYAAGHLGDDSTAPVGLNQPIPHRTGPVFLAMTDLACPGAGSTVFFNRCVRTDNAVPAPFVRLESEALSLGWLSDGEHIVAACSDGKLRIIDTVEVQVLKELGGIEGWAYSIDVNPIDGAFIIGGTNGQLKRFTSGGLPESD